MMQLSLTHQSGSQPKKQSMGKRGTDPDPVHPSRFSFLVVGIVVALSFELVADASATESSKKPNVLFIAIDDLNDWVGFLDGHLDAVTPHMDALAKRSCNFTNAHCDVPVCSPSRVSVMSGVTATKHGSYELGPKYEQLPALKNVPTMQRYFKDNGYYTLAGGKILHHGFSGRLSGDVDRSLGRNRSPRPLKPLNRPANWSRAWDWGKYPENDSEMADHQLAKNAAKALHEDFEKPFFMSVGFFRPHVPLYVPPKWFDLYDANAFMLPTNPKSDLDDLPENFLGINDYAAAPTHAEVVKHKKQRSLTHAYLASISFVDHCVGIIMEALKSSPHADNTLIVLWSDHGFHLGEKQHWAKRTLWEESTRVPLLFAGPGIAAGTSCAEAASLIDIYPTLVDLCNLPKNSHLDGISLVPQLRDPGTPREHPAITSSYAGNHSIRNRDWRLVVYEDGAEELYDHRNDPDEFHNLADQSEYKVIRDELARWVPQESAPEFKAKSERAREGGRKQPKPL
nr:sulfatase [Rubripirellula sp.]